MPSHVIGLIELDDLTPNVEWESVLALANCRFGGSGPDPACRGQIDFTPPAEFAQTELIEADAQQLGAELEAEFCRLISQLPAR